MKCGIRSCGWQYDGECKCPASQGEKGELLVEQKAQIPGEVRAKPHSRPRNPESLTLNKKYRKYGKKPILEKKKEAKELNGGSVRWDRAETWRGV